MANIILTKSDGTSDVTYTPGNQTGTQKNYGNLSAGLVEPETIRIQHFMRPPGAVGTDRHQIVLQKAVVEDSTNRFLVGSVSVQINVPRSSDYTLAMVKDLVAQMCGYLMPSANITALFNGGTPEGDFNVTGPFNPTMA